MERRLVFPGEHVAMGEEYLPGEGTYEEAGDIYASQTGVLALDVREKVARVRSFNPPVELREGDIVLATVENLRSTMAIVEVHALEGVERGVSGETEGTIHISKVSEEYTEDLKDAFRLGDIVRARVIQVEPSLQLATNEKPLGVAQGLCTNCRSVMVKKGRSLYCENCERSEARKVSTVYNAMTTWAKG